MNAIIHPKPAPGPIGVPIVFVEHVTALPRRVQLALKRIASRQETSAPGA